MSAATIEAPATGQQPIEHVLLEELSRQRFTGADPERSTPAPERSTPVRPTRRRRPARGSGRQAHPAVRPAGAVPPPVLKPRIAERAPGLEGRACRVDAAVARQAAVARPAAAGWRLTERGIGVVLIAGAMVVAAALTVITATALTVTSEDYRPPQVVTAGR